jgi:hypothetical protein
MVLTVSFVLPGDEFLFVTVASRIDDQSKPGWADLISARLSISNGCQDHTTSPYAATSTNPSTDHVLPAEF